MLYTGRSRASAAQASDCVIITPARTRRQRAPGLSCACHGAAQSAPRRPCAHARCHESGRHPASRLIHEDPDPGVDDASRPTRRRTAAPHDGTPPLRLVTHPRAPVPHSTTHAARSVQLDTGIGAPPLDASASPVRSTRISSGSEPAGPDTPELAWLPGPAVARPVRDTRIPLPDTPEARPIFPTPIAATAASADTTTATLFASSHRNTNSTTASTATTPAVPATTTRRALIPTSSTNQQNESL